jgi:hypothetical protein
MKDQSADNINHRFLVELCEATDGNADIQVSTPEIGDHIGIDKEAASQAAEYLIGSGYVEVRTLSGGIGITSEGISRARELGANLSSDADRPRLNTDPIVNETGRQAVDQTLETVKCQAGQLGLAYDKLSELVADLNTIDAQMLSPYPKTDIIRNAFLSLLDILKGAKANDGIQSIKDLLGL